MNDPAGGNGALPEEGAAGTLRYYPRDFWNEENQKFSRPHLRLEKSARIIRRIAGGRECTLLDIGCGPAALMRLLPPNIHYYGVDIAIHDPAPNLIEADILKTPIRFADKRFDIITAQGLFEYMGEFQSQKLAEIAALLNEDGKFVVSYWNYGHRNRQIYWAHSNVQSLDQFRADLVRHFSIDRFFPASHNWQHSSPNRRLNKVLNRYVNVNIPFISHTLAVEYFFLCSARGPGEHEARRKAGRGK